MADSLAGTTSHPAQASVDDQSLVVTQEQGVAEEAGQDTGTEKPLRFVDLPPEVRIMIYRYLFRRPTGILPTFNYVKSRSLAGFAEMLPGYYKYQFDGARQDRYWDQSRLPSLTGGVTKLEVSWTSEPTREQLKRINEGTWVQRKTESAPRSGRIGCWANRRSDSQVDILCKQMCRVQGLMGIGLLRTCKQIQKEGAEVLYGENRFVFNTAGIHEGDALQRQPYRIPGLPDSAGEVPDPREAIKGVFNEEQSKQHKFLQDNPLFNFAHRVGEKNFSLIKDMKLEGPLKTAMLTPLPFPLNEMILDIGLARTLLIYTTFIGFVCKDLRKLTLHVVPGRDILPLCRRHSDDERTDRMIMKVVAGLPALKQLRLGEYEVNSLQHVTQKKNYDASKINHIVQGNRGTKDDEWKGALDWIELVKTRLSESDKLVRAANLKKLDMFLGALEICKK